MMESAEKQGPKVTGYRSLTADEVALINEVKAEGERLRDLVDRVDRHIQQPGGPSVHPVTTSPARWLAEGRTDLQKGLMCLTRAVAAPTTF
ncbi:hypothetical protein JN531_003810 [Flagellatimonas centrodinii]|uniref:Acb2/Tad1 domain-containing protein n=1 Tax=Flagellatimonas centrodinii TaxID=2806210 RepID=UPI001FED9B7F|nr:hypothetical protein [Flagellatimonas centrodinii]ULQ47413.1 hypothetical protein JN531_003810 [Flagellatimonas centrodinii]